MAFVWDTAITLDTEQFNELRTNVDILRANISLGGWSWSSIPVSKGSLVLPTNPVDEVRNALDDTDNNNYCRSDYSSNHTPYCGTNYDGDRAGNNSGYGGCHGFCVIYWVPNYTTVKTTDNVVINGTCTTVNIQDHNVVQASWLHYKLYSVE